MKRIAVVPLAFALAALPALAQTGGMSGMDMKGMDKQAPSDKASGTQHQGAGVVKTVDSAAGVITIAHEPIKSLGWPAMTMGFKAQDPKLLAQAKPGTRVRFTVVQSGNDYMVTSIQ